MYKKSLALLLSLIMVLSIFSGCMNKNIEAEETDGHRVNSAIFEESSGEGTTVESTVEDFTENNEKEEEKEEIPADAEVNTDIEAEENERPNVSAGITSHESEIFLEEKRCLD